MQKIDLPTERGYLETEWSTDWPKAAGVYWFWGFPWGVDKRDTEAKPDLCCVQAMQVSNGFIYATEGFTLSPAEGTIGFWAAVELPSKPKRTGK